MLVFLRTWESTGISLAGAQIGLETRKQIVEKIGKSTAVKIILMA